METYILVLGGFGGVVLLTAWLPMVLKELPLSLPIVCVLIGAGVGYGISGEGPLPLLFPDITERALTWRLLGITMPLTIGAIALLGWGARPAAGLALPAALLAPTDPVLASDVQVGSPGSGVEDEVRFGLTSEAGLNDGLAAAWLVGKLLAFLTFRLPDRAKLSRTGDGFRARR